MPEPQHAALNALAAQMGSSAASLARAAIQQMLEKRELKLPPAEPRP